jgi:EmrB/QacA subfamily drug resistance transporter
MAFLPTGPIPHTDAPNPRRWFILAIVAGGSFMTTLDTSIVNISLPSIAKAFHTPVGGSVEWVVIIYLVTIASTLLTFGRLSDALGHRMIWSTGLIVFTIGSMACGAASSLKLLITARGFQGLGAAMIYAPSIAMLVGAFPPSQRGLALGLNAVVAAMGAAAGPTLGGIITQFLGWRWVFYVNIFPGSLTLIATGHVLAKPSNQQLLPSRVQFDPVGAILLAVSLATATLGLSFGQRWGWTSPRLIACIAAALGTLIAGVFVEKRSPNPVLHLSLIENRVFASALFSFVLAQMAMFSIAFLMPFYLEHLRELSPSKAGLLLTPIPITIGLISPLSGSLGDRFGSNWLAPIGLAIACLGLLATSSLGPQSPDSQIIFCLFLGGLGQALFQPPNAVLLMDSAPADEKGEASGLLSTGRVVGQSLSVALTGAIFAGLGGGQAALALDAAHNSAVPAPAAQAIFLHAFSTALRVSALVAATGVATALVRRSRH